MVAEYLPSFLFLISKGSIKSSTEDIDHTGLKKDQIHRIHFANSLINFIVSRKEILIIADSRQQSISRTLVEVCTDGLVQNLIT